jgi:hypothetical protein
MMRECATCYFEGEKWEYSSAQWRKGAGHSRCRECVEGGGGGGGGGSSSAAVSCNECGRVFSHGNRRANENSLQQHSASSCIPPLVACSHTLQTRRTIASEDWRGLESRPVLTACGFSSVCVSQCGRTNQRTSNAHCVKRRNDSAAWLMPRHTLSPASAAAAAEVKSRSVHRCTSSHSTTASCLATGPQSCSSTGMAIKLFQIGRIRAPAVETSKISLVCCSTAMRPGIVDERPLSSYCHHRYLMTRQGEHGYHHQW